MITEIDNAFIESASKLESVDGETARRLGAIYTDYTGISIKVGCLCKESNRRKLKNIVIQWWSSL